MIIYKAVLDENMRKHTLSGKDVKDAQLEDAVIQQPVGGKLIVQDARKKQITVSDEDVNKEIDRFTHEHRQ
jgi:hypothetical protein